MPDGNPGAHRALFHERYKYAPALWQRRKAAIPLAAKIDNELID
jgi:hypothetical protein